MYHATRAHIDVRQKLLFITGGFCAAAGARRVPSDARADAAGWTPVPPPQPQPPALRGLAWRKHLDGGCDAPRVPPKMATVGDHTAAIDL
jgi:hypothetical protein